MLPLRRDTAALSRRALINRLWGGTALFFAIAFDHFATDLVGT